MPVNLHFNAVCLPSGSTNRGIKRGIDDLRGHRRPQTVEFPLLGTVPATRNWPGKGLPAFPEWLAGARKYYPLTQDRTTALGRSTLAGSAVPASRI